MSYFPTLRFDFCQRMAFYRSTAALKDEISRAGLPALLSFIYDTCPDVQRLKMSQKVFLRIFEIRKTGKMSVRAPEQLPRAPQPAGELPAQPGAAEEAADRRVSPSFLYLLLSFALLIRSFDKERLAR